MPPPPEAGQLTVGHKAASGFPVDSKLIGDFINGHDGSCHMNYFPEIHFEIFVEIYGILQCTNSEQSQSADKIMLVWAYRRLYAGDYVTVFDVRASEPKHY